MSAIRDDDDAARRWTASFLAILALHAAIATAGLWWTASQTAPTGAPQSAIMVDLAPAPAAPPAPPTEIPPDPQQQQQQVEQPVPQPVKRMKTPPQRKAAVPLPPSSDRTRPVDDKKLVEQTTAPPTADAPAADAAASPSASASAMPSNAAPTWQALLLGRLEQFKRYPAEAQSRRHQGVVYLRFSMDRNGNVLSFRIEKTSGHDSLDREALALVQRAQPLPKPPAEVAGDPIELVTPVEFFLSERR